MAAALGSRASSRGLCVRSRLARRAPRARRSTGAAAVAAELKAVLFDCDGVILESEDLHRRAYNAAFAHFGVKVDGQPCEWSVEYYDVLSNTVGGGKPKMRWHFNNNAWPTSTVVDGVPADEEKQAELVDTLQEWKTNHYKELIGSGQVPTRPGILRVFDEARAAGLKVAVCTASTKEAAVFVVENMLGKERFEALDCFLAGKDVPKLKPDPLIYTTAAEMIGVDPSECIVVEDSMVGLRAALAAKMRCYITYTRTGINEDFEGAERVMLDFGDDPAKVTVQDMIDGNVPVQDDRKVNA